MFRHLLFQKRKIKNVLCGEITRTRREFSPRGREFSPRGGEIRLPHPHMDNVLITFRHNISLLCLLWCRLVCQDSN